jgi:hypothetical protein
LGGKIERGEREQPPLLEMREEVREEASSGLGGKP